ncbi:hypothetical protein [Alloalcanivorax xenomutans]|uniref:hypothetical protein n=1 Tax=Alloalcanivorax xenomutans TaxID=1094342 RepID=UPI0024E1DE97|nr:hypothetical protein [Alloalcanivorax xenomutans]
MPENEGVQKMAEVLSERLFRDFMWTKTGPVNVDWKCEDEKHKNKTHPADLVFYYDEPYSQLRTYVHCDMKSYGKGSITPQTVRKAFESLCKQVSCAEKSEEWQNLYMHDGVAPRVVGLLFLYNHDGEYVGGFDSELSSIKPEDIDIPKDSAVYIMGPDDVIWLSNVRSDLRGLRGEEDSSIAIPKLEECSFYYPQPVRKADLNVGNARAANLEMLLSSFIILKYKKVDGSGRDGLLLYYREEGKDEGEFLYLIDYFRHHELLDFGVDIEIRVKASASNAHASFGKAVQSYVERYSNGYWDTNLSQLVKRIKISSMENLVPSFNKIEIGMGLR